MDLVPELLELWDRQVRIFDAIATRVTEETRGALPSPDGWPLDRHLAHVHNVRSGWLAEVAPEREALPVVNVDDAGRLVVGEPGTPVTLSETRALLARSAAAVRETLAARLASGEGGAYTHPLHFLGHMVWHEGWHAGLVMTGLRLAGHEPSEEWEEEYVWSLWPRGVPTPWTG